MIRTIAALALVPAALAAQTTGPDTTTKNVQLTVVEVVPPINSQVGHAVQIHKPSSANPVQHGPEAFEAFFASLDVRSRGINDVQSDLSMRGSTFDQVHVMVDGVPYTDPQTGHHSMNLPVPIEAVASAVALPSGGSYRFGPFAFAGVVELQTIDPRSSRGYASASAGEFGYQRAAAGVPLVRKEKLASRLDVGYTAADGAFENTDFATWLAYLQVRRELEVGVLDVKLGYSAKMFGAQGFYSFRFPEQFEHVRGITAAATYRLQGLTARVFARQHHDRFELFRENANYYVPFGPGRWIHAIDSTVTPTWYTGANVHRNRSLGGEITYRTEVKRWILTGGTDARFDEIHSNALGLLLDSPLDGTWGSYTRSDARRNAGAFASAQTSLWKTRIQADLRANYNDRYGVDWLPHLGLDRNFKLGDGRDLKTFASTNRSFRLPTFTDLYYSVGGAQGSATLRPEYAWNTEFGSALTISGSHLIQRVGATAYERRGTNLIDWIYRSVDGNQVLQADNVTAVSIRGLEFEVGGHLAGTWFARAQFASHTASDVNGQSIYALDYLARRVQLTWNSALRRSDAPAPLQFGLVAIGQDRAGSYVLPDGSTTEYTPFATVDLRASYRLGDLLLYADGMNLLNSKAMDRGNIPLPGRWLKLGLRLEWE